MRLSLTFANDTQDHSDRDLDELKGHMPSRAHSARHCDDIHLSRPDSVYSRDSVCPGEEEAEEGERRRRVGGEHRHHSGVHGARNHGLGRRRTDGERGQRAAVRNTAGCVGARGPRGEDALGDWGERH